MIQKHEFPILEYSTDRKAIVDPRPAEVPFPRLCLVTFFEEVLEDFRAKHGGGEFLRNYRSEMKDFPAYKFAIDGVEFCVIQAVVAGGSIAMMTDWLYGKGVEVILCCGGAGTLGEMPLGHAMLPVRALRDEGASYKYLPPSRFIELDKEPVEALKAVMDKRGVPYVECTTWTTDGFYRETAEMVSYRMEEGCRVVEMECATMAAIAKFRGKKFGQLLYCGDLLVPGQEYDDRNWSENVSAREKLFDICLEALVTL